MSFNLQISTFIVGVLCSLRNQGNSVFSPHLLHAHAGTYVPYLLFLRHQIPATEMLFFSTAVRPWSFLCLTYRTRGLGVKWTAAPGSRFFGTPWRWLKIAVGRSRATTGHASLGRLLLHWGSQTPSRHREWFESTHPMQRTWWKQILQKSTETIGWAQLDLLWFRVRMMSSVLSRCHSEIAMRMQSTKSKPSNLPSSIKTNISNLPVPLTSDLSERSNGHYSILPQAVLATWLNPILVDWFGGVCLLVLELQAYFWVSKS